MSFQRLRADVGGMRSPKAATTARGCGRRALRRRWRRRHWWSRRRFATPRPLEFSVTVRSPPTRDCNLDLLIAALRPRLSASQAESRVGWTTAWSGQGAGRSLMDDALVVLGSPRDVSSAVASLVPLRGTSLRPRCGAVLTAHFASRRQRRPSTSRRTEPLLANGPRCRVRSLATGIDFESRRRPKKTSR